ncbi:uncharacterized protein LOC115880213 [Sitophilus oryzae]|uniref:Uncharacterized protein LOC115880213 n=1 Tax=Sitophilus oryzae TaxID=7048 RepID=A0A6J2XQV4_SITOR|nr:uncharacterized protein LOC115880213 [Sitophilus oryzae]
MIDRLKSTDTSCRHYYGPLVSRHVKTILESGLLLDEDYEVLLKSSVFKIYPIKPSGVPLGLIGGALLALGSLLMAKRWKSPLVMAPAAALTLALVCSERRSRLKIGRRQEGVGRLIKGLTKVRKLHGSIIRYMGLRKELISKNEGDSLLIYEKNIEDYIKTFIKRNSELFELMLQELEALSTINDDLRLDYKSLNEININTVLEIKNYTISDCLAVTKSIHDLHTFLSSKYLNYLGLSLHHHLQEPNCKSLEDLIDKTIPNLNNVIENLHEACRKQFNDLRYSASKKAEIETKNKGIFRRHVTGTLHHTLTETVNNLSVIMERSRAVLEKIETEEDPKRMEISLKGLRDHALATYESLDVLCRLYGILSDSNKNQTTVQNIPSKSIDRKSSVKTEEVHFDEEVEPIEENFELYIPQDEQRRVEEQRSYKDDSGVYLSLMLKELRQSLKKHERFIAARSKRGMEDEDDDKNTEEPVKEKSPPKFNLDVFNVKEPTKISEESVLESKTTVSPVTTPCSIASVPKLPPPPPPPPPSFNLSDLQEAHYLGNKRTFFENIKALSEQVQGEEEVFGNCDDSDQSDE